MSDYFNPPDDLAPETKARSVDINQITAATGAAFDKLPDELSLKGGTANFVVDASTAANTYLATMDSAIAAYFNGMTVRLQPIRTNTGACTVNVNGLGAIAVKRVDGSNPQAGDLTVNVPIELTYIASSNTFVLPPVVNSFVKDAANSAAAAAASAVASDQSAQASAGSASAAAGSAATALKTLAIESDNPPANPIDGQEWTDSTSARRYTWNANSSCWAETYAALSVDNPVLVEALASALQLTDYPALRDYAGDRKAVYVTGYLVTKAASGVAGMFVRDDSDKVATDNGGTIIVATNGVRWKRQFDGMMNVLWFGADPAYVKNSSPAFQAAILAGDWNGTSIYVPNGTYRDQDGIVIGTYNGQNCYSVRLIGESTHGTVILRPKGYSTGPILTISGFHNLPETMTLLSEVNAAGTDYSASHAVLIRGNPQPGTNGNGTKENAYRNLKIMRCGIGIQIGNYNVDGVDPDIETNLLQGIEISQCNGGVFYNGQNILHNHLLACHIVDCRDYLVKQTRGGDFSAERCYFGGLYDYLTNNYNVPATEKILISNGNVYMARCRSEDCASSTGNATPRFILNVTSTDSKIIHLVANTFTTRDNSSTEPCVNLSGQGTGGNASCKAILEGNTFYGYVGVNTIDIFSVGNSYLGTASGGNGVVDGRLRSANQKAQNFREIYLDSNQDGQLGQVIIKTASSNAIKHIRSAVAITSEWQGDQFYTDDGLLWGRGTGMRVTNATATQETAVHFRGARCNGAYGTLPETFGTAKPTNGTWQKNDRVVNTSGNAGEPDYWKCITAGTPGTWAANRKRGTFTCAAGATTTVNDTDVTTTSVILLMPTNAAAATLMNGATSLYVSARTAATSFALTTANAAAAAGTETFEYQLLN